MSFRKKKVQPNIQNSKRINSETVELLERSASDGYNSFNEEGKLQTTINLSTSYNIIASEQAEQICNTTYPKNITGMAQETPIKLSNEDTFLSSDIFIKDFKPVKVEQTTFLNDAEKTEKNTNEKVEKLLKKRVKIIPKVSSRNLSRPVDTLNCEMDLEKTILKSELQKNDLKKIIEQPAVSNDNISTNKPLFVNNKPEEIRPEGEKKLNKRTRIVPNISLANKTKTLELSTKLETNYFSELVLKSEKSSGNLSDFVSKNENLNEVINSQSKFPDTLVEKNDHLNNKVVNECDVTVTIKNNNLNNKAVNECDNDTLEMKSDYMSNKVENELNTGKLKNKTNNVENVDDSNEFSSIKVQLIEAEMVINLPEKMEIKDSKKLLTKRIKRAPTACLRNKSQSKVDISITNDDVTKKIFLKSPEKSIIAIEPLNDVASKDLASEDVASKDVASKDLASKDVASKDLASKDVATKDVASKDVSSKDIASKDVNSKDVAIDVDFDVEGLVDLTVLEGQDKKKHVRFNSHTNFEDQSHKANKEAEKEKNQKDINNETHSDYSSQSDGEVSSKLSISGKKVFKPNFEVQRRKKRLSSFSAYSSCDEDEDSSIKKKKKKVSKNKPKIRSKKTVNGISSSNKEQKEQEKKQKGENFSIEKNMSGLTMQELISYRPKSFKKVELKAKSSFEEGRVIETANTVPIAEPDLMVEDENDVMAPQIMVNEEGEIVINQNSLTIKKKVDNSMLKKNGILYEDSLSYHSGRKKRKIKHWGMDETLRFYKALSEIGTDFTLMAKAFGRFTRNELKKKFKQEEKINCDLVDRALMNRLPLDMNTFLAGRKERKMLEEAENDEMKNEDFKNEAKHLDFVINSDEPFLTSRLSEFQASQSV
ncbi:uncharacterized protein PF3D7_0207100 isoform X1 [Hydra vulgaris]|uniref:uncharacterized protein PF3D7_0207100 isoform X1 n=1 Tax=Hydra vulgaris TaxID=6087 RepID=UPI001F5EFAC2|nr:uncharacterized protein PF3D7_0207100 [Hydra vulgaris]